MTSEQVTADFMLCLASGLTLGHKVQSEWHTVSPQYLQGLVLRQDIPPIPESEDAQLPDTKCNVCI